MREILFKAKRVDNGEFVFGLPSQNFCGVISEIEVMESGGAVFYTIIPETVSQYTGLEDKNGKKIFEGDIVEFDCYSYEEPENTYTGEIVYSNGGCCFCLNGHDDYGDAEHLAISEIGGEYKTIITKLGNIHDNPELLGGE